VITPPEVTLNAIVASSKMLRNVFRLAGVSSFALVVFVAFALLIISIEQRRADFAILLTLGFKRRVLAASILLEGLLLLAPAAALGALAVWIPFHAQDIAFDVMFRVKIQTIDVIIAIVIGAFVGLAAATVPSLRVRNMDTLSALR
jgi:ABC-type antimicrobial peptide transport system permease subunit